VGLGLALAGLCLRVLPVARAQRAAVGLDQSLANVERSSPNRVPDKPSQPPAFTIEVAPLGFSPPGPIYLGQQNSLASLDFIDEDHLLFTFRVPGLIRREADDTAWNVERQIRAVVLSLPAGTAQAEALWTVHDRVRYLWMLKDGRFLLRDRDGLQVGDGRLELKPFLKFPGPLLWIGLDPTQQFLLTESREPAAAATKPGERSAQTGPAGDAQKPGGQSDVVVRILLRDSGQVILVTRVRSTVNLPVGADGYLESLRGNGQRWVLNLNYFGGGSRILGHVDSVCSPSLDFLSKAEVLVSGCDPSGGREMQALDMDGRRLWRYWSSDEAVWPLLVRSMDGSRVARETLAVSHPISANAPMGAEDVRGQVVEVFDAADGRLVLDAPVSPVLDAGGNVALSPTGRRVAVLNGGSIQVFELPAPPPLAPAPARLAR